MASSAGVRELLALALRLRQQGPDQTREGWLYLVVILDLFSRCILGWKLAETMESGLVTVALSRPPQCH